MEKSHIFMATWFITQKYLKLVVKRHSAFSKWCWINWLSICKTRNLLTSFIQDTKAVCRGIKVIHVQSQTLKLPDKNRIGDYILDYELGNDFLNKTENNKHKGNTDKSYHKKIVKTLLIEEWHRHSHMLEITG